MKRHILTIALLVGALLFGGLVAPATAWPPADANGAITPPRSTCLYMTRHVERAGSIYVGQFYVLRLRKRALLGYTGAFYSEWAPVRGTISGRTATLRIGDPYDPTAWTTLKRRWIPEEKRLKGWKRVNKATMRLYSGGNIPFRDGICG